MGGLGNQLFQIFTTLAYAFEYNYKVVFPYNDTTPGSVLRYTFWNNLLYPLSIFTTKHKTHNLTNENLMDFEEIYKEPCHEYQQIPNYMKTDLLLYGYFQSYLYFDKHFAKPGVSRTPGNWAQWWEDLPRSAFGCFARDLYHYVLRE